MKKRKKIVVLATTPDWEKVFEQALEFYREQQWFSFAGQEFTVEVYCKKKEFDFSDYNLQEMEADAFIARGTVAELIRQQVNVPVTHVSCTKSNIELAVQKAVETYDVKRIAAIGFNLSAFSYTSAITMIDDVELKIYDLISQSANPNSKDSNDVRKNIEAFIEKGVQEGYEAFVCGSYGTEYARKKGYPVVLYDIDFQQACDALEKAIYAVNFWMQQNYQGNLCRDVLNNSFEAIITINNEFAIEMYNGAAVRLLLKGVRRAERYLQELLMQELEQMGILNMVRTRVAYKDYIIEHKNELYVVNIVPNTTIDGYGGHIILLQNLTQMDTLSARNGKKMKSKQLLAKYHFEDINGKSKSILEAVETARIYAKNHMNVLIIGKTGTGKEMFAQSIHNASPRSKGPFVAINCAALPENLLESELFGYVEGAFTGASKGGKKGFFELAHGGTLFLDEVGEIPVQIQSKLLRAIQEREIVRLGDDKPTYIDVRILSATNRPMETLVQEGKFREDLYYRLDVLRVEIPTLDERRDDIPDIAKSFFEEFNRENGLSLEVDEAAYRYMMRASWEGNIRQLQNTCMRAAILAGNGRVTQEVIERALLAHSNKEKKALPQETELFSITSHRIGTEEILRTLKECGGNRSAAARKLGISRSTMYRKIQEITKK